MARVRFEVSFELPPEASREEAASYVLDAVQSWKGSLRPDGWDNGQGEGDPMHELDYASVRVTDRRAGITYIDDGT